MSKRATPPDGEFVYDAEADEKLWKWASKKAEAEALRRFANTVFNDRALTQSLDWSAHVAGMTAIASRMEKLTKKTGRPKNPEIEIPSPEFAIALDLAEGKASHSAAVDRLMTTIHKDQRTAERLLAEMRPHAERGAKILAEIADNPGIDDARKRMGRANLLIAHGWGLFPTVKNQG